MILSLWLSQTGRDVDGVALGEGHYRLLHVRLRANGALEALHLALADKGVDAFDLHIEELLHSRLDLGLGGRLSNLEDHLVLLGSGRRLLGDDRPDDDVVMTRI